MEKRPQEKLEPVERDPRKLRRTALIVLLVAVLGGVVILKAYEKLLAKQEKDPRPAMVARFNKNFAFERQDGKVLSLEDLKGKVWVACAVDLSQPESWARSREAMKKIAEVYRGDARVKLVCFSIDPVKDSVAVREAYAKSLGADGEQWWFVTAQREFVQKFLKDECRLGLMPSVKKDGTWEYNPRVFVVDTNLNLRTGKKGSAQVEFDFDRAAIWDQQGRHEGISTSNVEEMGNILRDTVEKILHE